MLKDMPDSDGERKEVSLQVKTRGHENVDAAVQGHSPSWLL